MLKNEYYTLKYIELKMKDEINKLEKHGMWNLKVCPRAGSESADLK